jgi:4-alpha-glucanotransferase
LIQRLAELRGLGDAYRDYRGELRYFSLETKEKILRSMGCAIDDAHALGDEIDRLEGAKSRSLLPPVAAARAARIGVDINLGAGELGASIAWVVRQEDGTRHAGSVATNDCRELWRGEVGAAWITRRRFELPLDLPPGYHELEASIPGRPAQCCLLIIAPPRCFEPPAIVSGGRLWGVAVQLYTLRSRGNWGIGDFSDLERLIRWLAPRGAGFIGLNPLHALSPADPARSSPYSASNRHFLNVLYIAVTDVPEYRDCPSAQARVADPQFAARLAALRAAALVDYSGAAAAKFEILELLYTDFRARRLAPGFERGSRFDAFVQRGGEMLEQHARFDALDRHLRGGGDGGAGWLSWPEEFRDPRGAAALRFAAQYPDKVQFFQYLQWLAHEQLGAAQALARHLGMPIGLYGDYAVGANAAGSEVWIDRTSYRLGAEIGAPPDALALKGQGWGIPPQDPLTLENQRLQNFVRLIHDNMRYYGALRLDHVMSLFRLWWVPAHSSPLDGAYVHYPLDELLTVLALESSRAGCLVVGEDLGVVPDEIRAAMPRFGLYHYKVVLFEKQGSAFRRPQEFVREALATITTHDMPTLRSYWDGGDIELRRRLNLYPSAEMHAAVLRERDMDRAALLAALRDQGLAPLHPDAPHESYTPEFGLAMHEFLGRSSAALAAVQIEDLLGMVDPVNVPGTDREYPNWQRKLIGDIEEFAAREDLNAFLAAIARARAAPTSPPPAPGVDI